MDITELAKNVFNNPPGGDNSINVEFECIEKTKDLFEIFIELFTEGMKILYGDNGIVDLKRLNSNEFKIVQQYFKSMRINLFFHIFHIQQIEQLENTYQSYKSHYNIIQTLTIDELETLFPEKPTLELLKKYSTVSSTNLIDYKFQLKVDDLLYVIYFSL